MTNNPAVQDICLGTSPTPQAAVDCISDWTSQFPAHFKASGGGAALFEDARVSWALQRLGGVKGKRVLELGPLEGGHTYMLERAGAAQVTAIEANRRCFMKCLITKEIAGLTRSRFLLGDFLPWLEDSNRQFDVIVAAGVLYHMMEPLKLLTLLGRATDRLYIYTHYIPDDLRPNEEWASSIVSTEVRDGVKHYIKSYGGMGTKAVYCGGVYESCAWLTKRDIFNHLCQMGFIYIDQSMDVRDHPNGPCINMVASRHKLVI
ncbi:Protein of unknown function [Enhydrobacter aerosaccus]|uniref:Methyltransferase domain-containing protein n=1 Tax=Enhydrobacter aerosaccus TaxID=225324 RepID=A0A1T4RPJ8_9HYPH|nr:class I SAM-dependent methyltransferase [Enhydrobacter aerosaccus]SKA17591.1 Protein of unknown function [Enhydrobacter aerosaccus]